MIVFDSSTLILLAKSEVMDYFLGDYPGRILVPREVMAECCERKKSPDGLIIKSRITEGKIEVTDITDLMLRRRLERDFRLGMGEAEALTLALEQSADLVAIDDKNGIKACRLLRMKFTTAAAILVRMAEKGVIDGEMAQIGFNRLARFGRYDESILGALREKLKSE